MARYAIENTTLNTQHAMQTVEQILESNTQAISTLAKQLQDGISLLGKKLGQTITVQICPPVGQAVEIGYRVQGQGRPYGLANAIALEVVKNGELDIKRANYFLKDKPFTPKANRSEEQQFFYSHL